jgi:hypothetical protein
MFHLMIDSSPVKMSGASIRTLVAAESKATSQAEWPLTCFCNEPFAIRAKQSSLS